jgi:SPP1 gp7 family putative phage head morphogenesis protein
VCGARQVAGSIPAGPSNKIMGKPFRVNEQRRRHIAGTLRRRNQVVTSAMQIIDLAMKRRLDEMFEHWKTTGILQKVALHDTKEALEEFYRSVVRVAIESSENDPVMRAKKKRLSGTRFGIPKKVRDFSGIFKDQKYWGRILKRAGRIAVGINNRFMKKVNRVFDEIREPVRAGQLTYEEAREMVDKSWESSKSQVETIFRTETTNYFAQVQVEYFRGNDEIIGFMFDSVSDTSRTDVCKSRHGLIYRPDETRRELTVAYNTPALHYNCRSHLLPVINSPEDRKMLEDPARDPARVRVAPLPPSWPR